MEHTFAPTISRRLRSKHDHNLRTPAEANPSESVINNKCVSASRPTSSEYRRNLKTHVQEKKSQLVHRPKHTSGKTHGNHMIASNLQHLAERFPSITFSFAPVEKKKSNVSSIISMQANNFEKKNQEGSTNMVSKVGRGYWADPKEVLDEFKENEIEEISIDYEVEKLLNYQAGQYLVKWVGYSEQESTCIVPNRGQMSDKSQNLTKPPILVRY